MFQNDLVKDGPVQLMKFLVMRTLFSYLSYSKGHAQSWNVFHNRYILLLQGYRVAHGNH